MDELHSTLRAGPARALLSDETVWHVPSARLWSGAEQPARARSIRDAAFSALANSGLLVFLRSHEDPQDPELMGRLVEHPNGAWSVRDPASLASLVRDELCAGNWTLYAASGPLSEPVPDPFRAEPQDLVDLLRRGGVTLFVDSFHDDTEWIVAIP